MELLQKIISKKYLALSFIMLMMTMGVVSCDCGGKKEEGTAGSLELTFGKDQLSDPEKKTKLTIKATKATKLEGLKLIATLTTSGAAATGNVKLTVGSNSETVEVGKESTLDLHAFLGLNEDVELQENEEKPVDIEFAPNGEQDLTLTVEIKNDKKDEVVGSAKTVEWKGGVKFTITPGATKFGGSNELSIELDNIGGEVTTADVTIDFGITADDIEFNVIDGGKTTMVKKGVTKTLADLLNGGPAKLATGKKALKIKLHDAKGKTASQLTITAKANKSGNAEVGKSGAIEWKGMEFTITPGATKFGGSNELSIELDNIGGEVTTADVTIDFGITADDIEFNVIDGGKTTMVKKGVTKTLADLLDGGPAKLVTGKKALKIKLHDAKGKTASQLTITAKASKAGNAEVGKSGAIEWKGMEFTITPGATKFGGSNELSIELDNIGGEVTTADVTIDFGITEADIEFEVIDGSHITVVEQGVTKTLADLLDGGPAKLATGKKALKIKLHDAQGKNASQLTITAKANKSGNAEVGKSGAIEWKGMEFTITPAATQFGGNNELSIELDNIGGEVTTADVTIDFGITEADIEFEVIDGSHITVVEQGVTKTLADLLNGGPAKLATGKKALKIKLHDAQGKTASQLTITAKANKSGNAEVGKSGVITWEKGMEFTITPAANEFTATNELSIELDNTGGEVTTADATIDFGITMKDIEFEVIDGSHITVVKQGVTKTLADLLDGGPAKLATGKKALKIKLHDAKGKTVSQLTITAKANKEGNRQVGKSGIITWKKGMTFTITPAATKFAGNNKLSIELNNTTGSAVTTADVTIDFGITEADIEFEIIDGTHITVVKQGVTKTLADLLDGGPAKLATGKKALKIKLHDAQGKNASQLTITAKANKSGNAEVGKSGAIEWKGMEFTITPAANEFTATNELSIELDNIGSEVTTADVTIDFGITEADIEFEVIDGTHTTVVEQGVTKTLADLLDGGPAKLATGKKALKIKLHDAQGKNASQLTITAKANKAGNVGVGKSAAIEWKLVP